MDPVRSSAMVGTAGESTDVVRARVAAARAAAHERWAPHGYRTNAEVSGVLLRRRFRPAHGIMAPLLTALDRGVMSIRGVDRTMRVAWSICDLAGRSSPTLEDVTTALSFRRAGAAR